MSNARRRMAAGPRSRHRESGAGPGSEGAAAWAGRGGGGTMCREREEAARWSTGSRRWGMELTGGPRSSVAQGGRGPHGRESREGRRVRGVGPTRGGLAGSALIGSRARDGPREEEGEVGLVGRHGLVFFFSPFFFHLSFSYSNKLKL